jgi:hypothetical protein
LEVSGFRRGTGTKGILATQARGKVRHRGSLRARLRDRSSTGVPRSHGHSESDSGWRLVGAPVNSLVCWFHAGANTGSVAASKSRLPFCWFMEWAQRMFGSSPN